MLNHLFISSSKGMKKFIIRLLLFSMVCMIPVGTVFLLADGTSDEFYVRFTTPRQHALILGSSRAAQGLQPVFLDSVLRMSWPDMKMFNYAFTRPHSPYGPAYYTSVKKKLDPETKNGVFILCVEPWTLASKVNEPADSARFAEDDLCVGTTTFVNMNPNIDYLVNSYRGSYATIVQHRIQGRSMIHLHNNGWLEVNVPMTADSIAGRTDRKVREYQRMIDANTKIVTPRIEYLEKTVEFLKQHGEVYLVRLPINEKLLALEEKNFPGFSRIINSISSKENVPYFDLSGANLPIEFTDGDHISRKSTKLMSIEVSKMILQHHAAPSRPGQ
jgi:hypothetical protein